MAAMPHSRNTRQKDAIRAAFLEADRPLSPEELLTAARQKVDALSIATIYRNIGQLMDERWLTPVEVPGAATHYEVAGKAHHHHFQCTVCNTIHELEGCELQAKPHLPRGFRYTHHEYFVYGTCPACSR